MLVDACIIDPTNKANLEMLEFRIQILDNKVDRFVVVEGDRTFTGIQRPFVPLEEQRFARLGSRLKVHEAILDGRVYARENPDFNTDAWKREAQQRNAILDACSDLGDQDVVIISDVDEVPSHEAIKTATARRVEFPIGTKQLFVWYNMHWRHQIPHSEGYWHGSLFTTAKQMRSITPQGLRDNRAGWESVSNGGWHLTFFGGVEAIQHKIQAFSHEEMNKPWFTNERHLTECLLTGKDFGGREDKVTWLDEKDYPGYVVEAARKHGWF